MSTIKELKREIQEAQKLRLRFSWRTNLIIIPIGAALIFLFALYGGRLEFVLPFINIVIVLGFVLVFKWKLRRHAWFWITMTIIAALHIILLLFIPWTITWVPAMAIAGIVTIDFCLILWILIIVGKLVGESSSSKR